MAEPLGRRPDMDGFHVPSWCQMRHLRLQPISLITEHYERPEAILERLRKEDPDAHALLTEHLVLPASPVSSREAGTE